MVLNKDLIRYIARNPDISIRGFIRQTAPNLASQINVSGLAGRLSAWSRDQANQTPLVEAFFEELREGLPRALITCFCMVEYPRTGESIEIEHDFYMVFYNMLDEDLEQQAERVHEEIYFRHELLEITGIEEL